MCNESHIDRIVESIHNPPKEILDALIKEQEEKEFAWMENYKIPEENLKILRSKKTVWQTFKNVLYYKCKGNTELTRGEYVTTDNIWWRIWPIKS